MFLTRKAAHVLVQNARNESCKGKRIKYITVETRPSDREVGGSGAAGSIPDLRHQPPGLKQIYGDFASSRDFAHSETETAR